MSFPPSRTIGAESTGACSPAKRCSADDEPFLREDGRCDWVRWELAPWYKGDGSLGGAVLFTEVVTARKHAEEALRESELRFRSLVNAASNVV
jgi:PAS domain-containing protein